MAGEFTLQLSRFVEKAHGNAEQVIRKLAIDMHSSVIRKTPVDTGRARGNWQITVASPSYGATPRLDLKPYGSKPGTELAMEAQSATASFKLGEVIFLTNGLPYARRLEYGWSSQAPSGMVRTTILDANQFIERAVRALS